MVDDDRFDILTLNFDKLDISIAGSTAHMKKRSKVSFRMQEYRRLCKSRDDASLVKLIVRHKCN